MQGFEMPLLTTLDFNQKTVSVEGIKAVVTQNSSSNFEVLLEINSNKILIALQGAYDAIEPFEILAVKGFVELSVSFINTIKKLVGHLLCRLD